MKLKKLLLYLLSGIGLIFIGFAVNYYFLGNKEEKVCETCNCPKTEENPQLVTANDVKYTFKDICEQNDTDDGDCIKEVPIIYNNVEKVIKYERKYRVEDQQSYYRYILTLDNKVLYDKEIEIHSGIEDSDYIEVIDGSYLVFSIKVPEDDSNNYVMIYNKDAKEIFNEIVFGTEENEELKTAGEQAFYYSKGNVYYWLMTYDEDNYLTKYQAKLTQNGLTEIEEVDKIEKDWGQV